VVLLALVLATGALGWAVRDRATRQVETEGGVMAALAQAETFLSEGDKQIDQPERCQVTVRLAQEKLEKAEGLLAAGVATADLTARVRQVRAAVEAALTDSRLLVELDRIRLEQAAVKDGRFDDAGAAPRYAELLGNYGIDLNAPEEAAARVRDSRLREALLSALADWRWVTLDGGERQRVGNVYRLAVPPDSLRTRLAAAVRRRDGAELAKLMQEPSFQEVPPATLIRLAKDLAGVKEWAAGEQLLRAGLEGKPGDFWLNHDLGWVLQNQLPPRLEEAVRYYTAALALRPDSPGVHLNLGNALKDKGDVEGAIRRYRAAQRISPVYAMAHINLGALLCDQKHDYAGAIVEFQEAIRLKKDFPEAHFNLGNALRAKGLLDEAIAEYQEAIRLKKVYPEAHYNLGQALADKGQMDEAMAEYREALRLKNDYPRAHTDLGNALADKGRLDEAITEYREALRLKNDFPYAHIAHSNLGLALFRKGQVEEAITEYREALRLKNDYPWAHNELGNALRDKGLLDEAIAEFRETLRLKNDYPEAYCNLGQALWDRGELRQALEALRRGHELGSKNSRWPYPSAQWVRNVERLVELDGKLAAILSGQKQPADAAERLALAELCQLPSKKQYAAAVRFFQDAFAAEPKLPGDQPSDHRYNAACAAALAGCGQGADAAQLDSKGRDRLRQQALDWLRADLKAYRQLLEKSQGKAGPAIAKQMQHWLRDDDFAGVRGAAALARLPTAERQEWEKLWQEVEVLRQGAAERPAAASPARP
jgi:tetratricopeptide (TPR) repeat protein